MRTKFIAFLGLILALALLTINMPNITNANANQKERIDVYDEQKTLVKSVVFVIGMDEYFVNNQKPGVKMDTTPFVENGRTFVPVRFLGHALGVNDKDIKWDGKLRKATLEMNERKVELTIGSRNIITNGKPKAMDVSPLIRNQRTHLPARYVAEALGFVVVWDPENNIVLAYPEGSPKPDVSEVIEYIGGKVAQDSPVEEPAEQTPVLDDTPDESGDTYTYKGYTIPKNTALYKVETDGEGFKENSVEISILLNVLNPLEPQRQDAYKILASKFGDDFAEEVIEHISTKTQDSFSKVEKKFWIINNQKVFANSPPGYFTISIVVWEPGHDI